MKKIFKNIGIVFLILFTIGAAMNAFSPQDNIEETNSEKEKVFELLNSQENFINLDGTQKCTILNDYDSVSCTLEISEEEVYKFYQDYVTLEIKPQFEDLRERIEKFLPEDFYLDEYSIIYKDKKLIYSTMFNNFKTTEDVFYPFLSNFSSSATFDFNPRTSNTDVDITVYNNSKFKKVDLHLYFTDFKDENGKKGKTGFLATSDSTLSFIYFNIKNNGNGVSGDYFYQISHKNKIIEYKMVIEKIITEDKEYTFFYEFDYDGK